MFYDLNVAVVPSQRAEAAGVAARLGFDVIAFNTTVRTRKLTEAEHGAPELPDLAEAALAHDASALRVGSPPRRHVRALNRITIVVDEVAALATLNSPILEGYDLVAVAPTTEKLFQQCLQFDFDIIALQFASKQNFYVKRPQLHVAVEKGIMFEFSFASALEDAHARRMLIGNTISVSRVTMGKQTIISSGAKTPIQMRGPHDIINLGSLFGMSAERSRQAVCEVSGTAVKHGNVRKSTHKGILRKLDAASIPFPEKADIAL